MARFLSMFLAVLIWRGSSGLAVWNQKPAHYWQGAGPASQTVPGSGAWTQVSQSSSQVGASVSASPAQQQSVGQSAGGTSWFGSLSQWSPPVSPAQTNNPVPSSGSWTKVSQASPQVGAGVSAFPSQQQAYGQSASWIHSQVQGPSTGQGPSQLTRPVPASDRGAHLYSTGHGAYGLQSSGSPSWSTRPQRPSPVSTQFQPSQNAGQVMQGATSSGSSKWFKVSPPGGTPSWTSTPPAWVPATNNLYASLSQVSAPSADSRFQSAGPVSAFQTSRFSPNSAPGSPSFSQTPRVPASTSGVLTSPNLGVSTLGPLIWQSGSSQSVLQGSVSADPAVQPKPLTSSPSKMSMFLPGSTSSFSLVPGPNTQGGSPYAQTPALRVPSNQQNFNTAGTSSGAAVRPGSSSSVKG